MVDPLRRNGIYPSRSVVTSGDDSIRMGLYFGGEELTSLVKPTLSENDADHLQLAVHQSAVNFTAHPLSGETRSLSEAVTELLPNEDPNAEAVDPLEITFAEQPFRVVFWQRRGNRYLGWPGIQPRGTRLRRDGNLVHL